MSFATSSLSPILANQWTLAVSQKIEDPQWDAFLANVPAGHHVQSSAWAKTKASLGWRVLRIKVLQEGTVVAGMQILMMSKPFLGKLAFASKAPVFLHYDEKLAAYFLKELKKLISRQGVRYFILQPSYLPVGLEPTLQQANFHLSETSLAPLATVMIDLQQGQEALLAAMRKKTRQYIHKSARDGIVIREGTEPDITTFYALHSLSAQRIGFSPFAESYYQNMWQAFKQSQEPMSQIALLLAEKNGEVISALLIIGFNDTVITKTIGWSGLYAKHRPNEAIYWAAIQWAKAKGYRYLDLEGIQEKAADSLLKGETLSEDMRQTPSFFKTGFGGDVKKMPQAYAYIPNPVIKWAYQTVLPRVQNSSLMGKLLERIRTQEHGR